jgi:hypothetical protein
MAIFVFVAGAVWGLSRSNNALLLVIVAVAMALVGAGAGFRRVVWPVAAGLLLVAVVGTVLANSTSEIRDYNTGQIVVRRILSDPERLAWFEDHGMPRNGRAVATPPFPPGIYDPAKALEADPRFGRWIREDASGTYLRYLLSHPGYVIDTPFTHGGALPGLATGLTAYGSSEQVLPDFLEAALWPHSGGDQSLLGAVVVAVLVAAGVAARWSPPLRRAVAGAGVVLVAVLANLVIVTHTAGWEYERLVMSVDVAFRFAVLWLLAALLSDLAVVAPASPARAEADVTTLGPTEWPDRGSDRRDDRGTDPATDGAPSTEVDPVAAGTTPATSADPVPGRAGTR